MKSGTVSQIKLEEGILDFRLKDETGKTVKFDPFDRTGMVEGIEEGVRQELLGRIGEGEMTPLSTVTDEETGETEGNA